jgi:hypothetical protein
LFTLNVGLLAVFTLSNLTVTDTPGRKEKLFSVSTTVITLAAVAAAVSHVPLNESIV